MKNILYIGNQLSNKNKTATTIDTLSVLLRSEGFNVTIASSKKNKFLRLLDMLYHIINYRKSIDYVLIDTYSTYNFYYAYLCSRLCKYFKLKYVPILHGGNLPNRLKRSPKFSSQIFKNAHVNIAPSRYLLSFFEKAGYKNISHIPNTIELQNYGFKERKLNDIHLLWVRSFSNLYNPKLAVKILKLLKDDDINASLCMIGPDNDGSLKTVKAYADSLNLDVEFTGKLSKEEWHKKAESFNIFINTSNIDNMPISIVEAMALGLPVVSTNVGGLPFLIKDYIDGILVKPDDVEAFMAAILRLKNDASLVEQITINAREKVEQFDWKVVKNQWISILS
ncbi:glycosyltransferase [Hyunsoonleella flava]|uniref:Glycosyltransferase n=1 Tax=Hyunsoonleella flava TaxID=2527939 RepID=A0A4Q9FDH0_9FLAO|nr:glycosyltransferase family 4 protein [Hyunsoonleella flava]TBN03619.1 glycosyltransferase [Hyunsoonleella flava]